MVHKFLFGVTFFANCCLAATSNYCPDYSGYFMVEDYEPGANYYEMMVYQNGCKHFSLSISNGLPVSYEIRDTPNCSNGKKWSHIASFKDGLTLSTFNCANPKTFYSREKWSHHFSDSILVILSHTGETRAGRRLGD